MTVIVRAGLGGVKVRSWREHYPVTYVSGGQYLEPVLPHVRVVISRQLESGVGASTQSPILQYAMCSS